MESLVTSHNSSAHGVLIFKCSLMVINLGQGIAIMSCMCSLSISERRNIYGISETA